MKSLKPILFILLVCVVSNNAYAINHERILDTTISDDFFTLNLYVDIDCDFINKEFDSLKFTKNKYVVNIDYTFQNENCQNLEFDLRNKFFELISLINSNKNLLKIKLSILANNEVLTELESNEKITYLKTYFGNTDFNLDSLKLPTSIYNMQNLDTLVLGRVGCISDSISKLNNLLYLNIEFVHRLPDGLFKLNKLSNLTFNTDLIDNDSLNSLESLIFLSFYCPKYYNSIKNSNLLQSISISTDSNYYTNFANLPELNHLEIGSSENIYFESNFSNLPKLNRIVINCNELFAKENAFNGLPLLNSIIISQNQTARQLFISPYFFNSMKLKSLIILPESKLYIPKEISKLNSLDTLMIRPLYKKHRVIFTSGIKLKKIRYLEICADSVNLNWVNSIKEIQYLNLSGSKILDEELKYLWKSKNISDLTISYSQFTLLHSNLKFIKNLNSITIIPSIKYIECKKDDKNLAYCNNGICYKIQESNISEAELKKLIQDFPKTKFILK